MRCWGVGLLLVLGATIVCSTDAGAVERARKVPKSQRVQYPPRYTRDTMAQWFVYRNRHGEVKTRKAYPGYESHFPPPAYLYYGYPKSGDYTGLGIDGTP